MTPKELSALPERKDTIPRLATEEEVRSMGLRIGDSIVERIPPKFVQYKVKPDDVILFHDAEGSWIVDYHLEGGPYKRRFYA